MGVLSATQLANLKKHEYKCKGYSILDNYVMCHFWNWLVLYIPLWIAPNLITIVGLVINIATTLVLVWFSSNADKDAPEWAYLLCALGVFLYQTLDAIDGKQARRTKTSSPLGEMFDHGCDSVSIAFLVYGTGIALKLGPTMPLIVLCMLFMAAFFCAHWQTYVTGILEFGRIDVTEGQFLLMIIHIISAFAGADFWHRSPLGVDNMNIVLSLAVGGLFYMVLRICVTVLFRHQSATVAGTSVISPIFPVIILLGSANYIVSNSATDAHFSHCAAFVFAFGFAFSKVTNQLVVAQMTKSPFVLFDSVLIGPILLALNIKLGSLIDERVALYVCAAFTLFSLLQYSYLVCCEICDFLKISCFTIPRNSNMS